jgi:hypothetical protein
MDEIGIVHRETPVPLAGLPGQVILGTRGGLVKAWIAEEDAPLEARWGDLEPVPAGTVDPDSVIPLTGKALAFTLEARTPGVVHFETDHAAAAALADADGRLLLVIESTTCCRFDHLAAAGRYTISVRGLEGADLVGRARFSVTEVTPLKEGTGPSGLIANGGSRTFSFVVPEKKPIGIGLKAGREVLRCEVRTADEKLVGTGIQPFVVLDPGTYLLRVSASPGEEPVRFVPVILGIDPPGKGPPAEAIREFMDSLGIDGEGN